MPYDDDNDILQRRKRILALNNDSQNITDQLNSQYPNGVTPQVQPVQQQVQGPPQLATEGARPPLQFNVAPVDTPPPPPPGPSPFQQMLTKEPMRDDYKPSTGRKVLGGVLGVLNGVLSGNPQYGMNTAHNFDYQPYSHAHSDWQQHLENLYSGEKEQAEMGKNQATIDHLKSQSEAEVARKGAEVSRGKAEDYKSSPEYQKNQLALIKAKEKPGVLHNIPLKDGSTIYGAASRAEGGFIYTKPDGSTVIIDNDAIDPKKKIEAVDKKGTGNKSDFQQMLQDAKDNAEQSGQEFGFTEEQDLWKKYQEGKTKPIDPEIARGRKLTNDKKENDLKASLGPEIDTITKPAIPGQAPMDRLNPEQQQLVNDVISSETKIIKGQGFGQAMRQRISHGMNLITQLTGVSQEVLSARAERRDSSQKSLDLLTKLGSTTSSLNAALDRHGLILTQARAAVPDTDITKLNSWLLSGAREFNITGLSAASVKYGLALQAVRNEYARVISGGSASVAQTPPQAFKDAGKFMADGLSKGPTQAMVDQIRLEAQQKAASYNDERTALMNEMSQSLLPELHGQQYSSIPVTPQANGQQGNQSQSSGIKVQKNKRTGEYRWSKDGGQTWQAGQPQK